MNPTLRAAFVAKSKRLNSLYTHSHMVQSMCGRAGALTSSDQIELLSKLVPDLTDKVAQLGQLQNEILQAYIQTIAEVSAHATALTEQVLIEVGLNPKRVKHNLSFVGNRPVWQCSINDPYGELASYPFVEGITLISQSEDSLILRVCSSDGRSHTTVTLIKRSDGQYETIQDLY